MKKKFLVLPIMLILLLMLAPPALAQVPENGGVVFGSNLTVQEGQNVDGDVVIFGGNLSMEEDSKVNGDVVVFGGNANINGKIDGDIVMIGGNITLDDEAEIEGDVGLVGGNASVAEGAKVKGKIHHVTGGDGSFVMPIPPIPDMPEPPEPPQPPDFSFGDIEGHDSSWGNSALNFISDVIWNIALLVVLAGIAWLVAVFMPQQIKTAGDAIVEAPLVSYGVGFLTTAVLVLLIITICLACIGAPALALLSLFGWIVLGQIVGERLLVASGNRVPNFALSTSVGIVVLTALVKMPVLSSIFCLGVVFWLIGLLVLIVALPLGVGGAVLTRFGTRPYYAQNYSSPGGPAPRPRPDTWTDYDNDEDFSDLNVNSSSEAELKAKIKAALNETDTAVEEKPKKKRTPRKKATDEETPAAPPDPEDPSDAPEEDA